MLEDKPPSPDGLVPSSQNHALHRISALISPKVISSTDPAFTVDFKKGGGDSSLWLSLVWLNPLAPREQ